jgi:hypothetical protein
MLGRFTVAAQVMTDQAHHVHTPWLALARHDKEARAVAHVPLSGWLDAVQAGPFRHRFHGCVCHG